MRSLCFVLVESETDGGAIRRVLPGKRGSEAGGAGRGSRNSGASFFRFFAAHRRVGGASLL